MTEDEPPKGWSRRRLLEYAGVTAGVTGAAGVAGWGLFASDGDGPGPPSDDAPSPGTSTDGVSPGDPETTADRSYPYADRFETVVDVAARGGDTSGEEPINDVLEANLADDTLFYFPEGTYRIAQLFVVQHHDNVGFVGPAATLRPSPGQIGDWLIAGDVSRLLIEGLTLSNAASRTGARAKVHVSGGENVVRDVSVTGFQDVPARTHGFTLQVSGADTVLRMANVDLTDGARNGTGIYVHPSKDPGTLRLENCRVENWYEQGLYGSSHGGPMYVVGGRYANNGKAQVRVGGGSADTEAIVRDVTVRMTDPQPADAKGSVWGIWLHEGAGTLVENCDVAVTDLSSAGSSGAVVLGAEQGATTIRDTTISVDESTFAIAATSPKDGGFVIPSMDSPPENWELLAENVTITGGADSDVGIWIVDRPGCTLRDITIDQGGAARDGIGLLRSPNAEITGLSCTTSGFPVVTDVPDAVEGCLVSLEGIDALESTRYRTGGTGEEGAPTAGGTAESTPTIASASASGGARAPAERVTVRPRDGRYCLDPAAVTATSEWPVLGVTHLDADELHVRQLSESALNPY